MAGAVYHHATLMRRDDSRGLFAVPFTPVDVHDRTFPIASIGICADTGLAAWSTRVVPLTGDASDRSYFRVAPVGGPSVVLALHAGPIEFATLPFVNVANLLAQMPMPVPAACRAFRRTGNPDAAGPRRRDAQAHLGAASGRASMRQFYRQAVALIELLQRRGAELESDRYLPYRIAFDVEKLTWELEYFVRNFLEGYRGIVLAASEREALSEEWAAIVNERLPRNCACSAIG